MTKPLELAQGYMKSFFGQAPLETMATLLADDLVFEGPFDKFFTAKDYIDALQKDPPADVRYVLQRAYEDENSACLIYMFSKPGIETRMVQTFEIADEKICRITLVFDKKAFA